MMQVCTGAPFLSFVVLKVVVDGDKEFVVSKPKSESSYATHNRKLKELSLLRSKSPSPSHFFSAFSKTLTPLFDFHRRLASTDRVVSFVSTFAAAADDEFLDHFLKFLLAAAATSNKTARYRACQIVMIVDDSRPIYGRVAGCFMNKFFPSGYPYRNLSNNELSMTVGDVFALVFHILGPNSFTILTYGDYAPMEILFFLQKNQLTGPLSVLVGLPLDTLNVANNNFSGWIPHELSSIHNFIYDGNSFENAPASLPPKHLLHLLPVDLIIVIIIRDPVHITKHKLR
ncbi:hypothetical protein Fmac_030611 [Flemingia macrophylla]|uniref:Uncharacterized protein n=1 Tax=Flemingia macrophylla TaxID=520843 RepID=A0ABD1KZQ0_9FABA